MPKPTRLCTIPGCEQPHRARGWCQSHYNAWHYSGDVASIQPGASRCRQCGGDMPPKGATGPAPTYCSRVCRSRRSYVDHSTKIRTRRLARSHEERARVIKACACCGEPFTPKKSIRQMYCSPACGRRVQNAARRAKVRGVAIENLHWRLLIAEDGPECHICGDDVDSSDFEIVDGHHVIGLTYPTLDHIVPLAMGGTHERQNARLAHQYCNSVKGARPLSALA